MVERKELILPVDEQTAFSGDVSTILFDDGTIIGVARESVDPDEPTVTAVITAEGRQIHEPVRTRSRKSLAQSVMKSWPLHQT